MSLHNIVFMTCSHWWWNAKFDYVTVRFVQIIHTSAIEQVTGYWRYINALLSLLLCTSPTRGGCMFRLPTECHWQSTTDEIILTKNMFLANITLYIQCSCINVIYICTVRPLKCINASCTCFGINVQCTC